VHLALHARGGAEGMIKALLFDVFGTLVDWRTGVAREAREILAPLGVQADWLAFADAWRDQYQPSMEEVRAGRLPFGKLDVLHRRNLDVVLRDFGLDRVDEAAQIFVRLLRRDPGDARARERLDEALRIKTQRRKGP